MKKDLRIKRLKETTEKGKIKEKMKLEKTWTKGNGINVEAV